MAAALNAMAYRGKTDWTQFGVFWLLCCESHYLSYRLLANQIQSSHESLRSIFSAAGHSRLRNRYPGGSNQQEMTPVQYCPLSIININPTHATEKPAVWEEAA